MFVLTRYFGAKSQNKGQKKGRGRRPEFYDYGDDDTDYADVELVLEKATPVQNVYFFQKGTVFSTKQY